jgi:hypothetical protein
MVLISRSGVIDTASIRFDSLQHVQAWFEHSFVCTHKNVCHRVGVIGDIRPKIRRNQALFTEHAHSHDVIIITLVSYLIKGNIILLTTRQRGHIQSPVPVPSSVFIPPNKHKRKTYSTIQVFSRDGPVPGNPFGIPTNLFHTLPLRLGTSIRELETTT